MFSVLQKQLLQTALFCCFGCSLFWCIPALDSLKDDNKDQEIGIGVIRGPFKIPAVTIAEKVSVAGSFTDREILQNSSEVG